MQAAALLPAAGVVTVLALVALAPGAAAFHDPIGEPTHVPTPTAVEMLLTVVPDPAPVMGPVEQSVAMSMGIADTLTGGAIDDTLAFTDLFQERFDELRAIARGATGSADATVHGCPSGQPLPPVDPDQEIRVPTAEDATALAHAPDPWAASPGSFANEESACRSAQALQTAGDTVAEVMSTELPA